MTMRLYILGTECTLHVRALMPSRPHYFDVSSRATSLLVMTFTCKARAILSSRPYAMLYPLSTPFSIDWQRRRQIPTDSFSRTCRGPAKHGVSRTQHHSLTWQDHGNPHGKDTMYPSGRYEDVDSVTPGAHQAVLGFQIWGQGLRGR